MEPDPDEHVHPGQEDLQWGQSHKDKIKKGTTPTAKYNKLSEQARKMMAGESQCALFCGGAKCKYCTAAHWKPQQMAIQGLYSHWVTDNILAMARPSNAGFENDDILNQFTRHNIRTVINLQQPGEHASCGHGNDPKSGFSYNPQLLMDQQIFFYNFQWVDYGIAPMSTLLDIVKVMQFGVSMGKVAVHCHAGLGRTGLLIACYLVYNNRENAGDAVQYVRSRRPGSIQTKQQVQTVYDFERHLKPFRTVFPTKVKGEAEVSFKHFLNRQSHMIHGFEARRLKHIPKVVYMCCERLLELGGCGQALSRVRDSSPLLPPSTPTVSMATVPMATNAASQALLVPGMSQPTMSAPPSLGFRHSVSLEDLTNANFKNVLKEAGDSDELSLGSSSTLSQVASAQVANKEGSVVNQVIPPEVGNKEGSVVSQVVSPEVDNKEGAVVSQVIPPEVGNKEGSVGSQVIPPEVSNKEGSVVSQVIPLAVGSDIISPEIGMGESSVVSPVTPPEVVTKGGSVVSDIILPRVSGQGESSVVSRFISPEAGGGGEEIVKGGVQSEEEDDDDCIVYGKPDIVVCDVSEEGDSGTDCSKAAERGDTSLGVEHPATESRSETSPHSSESSPTSANNGTERRKVKKKRMGERLKARAKNPALATTVASDDGNDAQVMTGEGSPKRADSETGSIVSNRAIKADSPSETNLSLASSGMAVSPEMLRAVVRAMAADEYTDDVRKRADHIEEELNKTDAAWNFIACEESPDVLSAILWDWLDQLKEPVLKRQDLTVLLEREDGPRQRLHHLEKSIKQFVEYQAVVVSKLFPESEQLETSLVERLLSHLTHQWVSLRLDAFHHGADQHPHWGHMKSSQAQRLIEFFFRLIDDMVTGASDHSLFFSNQ